jgi:hypothetical protein
MENSEKTKTSTHVKLLSDNSNSQLPNKKHGGTATPLDEKTRHLFELSIVTHLMLKARQKKGAESKELFDDLVKRGCTAIRSVKQVSMICIGLRNRDILISEQVRLQGKIRSDWKRKIYWRINPDYFTAHHLIHTHISLRL